MGVFVRKGTAAVGGLGDEETPLAGSPAEGDRGAGPACVKVLEALLR